MCVSDSFQKPDPKKLKTKKETTLDNTIAFSTMDSESGKLESTMMHTAHNGLTNCSFVLENTPLF